MILFIYHHLL